MRLHRSAGGRPRRVVPGMVTLAALAMTLAACSSSGGSSTAQGPASQPASANQAAAPATSAPQPATGLSGKWSGQYSGAYQGTFVLRWHQSGSRLNGRITLSAPSRGTSPIHGKVVGGAIRFGTVGSQAITYSGSVSGSSMSGTWKIQAPDGSSVGGGSWSASRS